MKTSQLFFGLLIATTSASAFGQGVVQLPEITIFSVGTTVSVPDRGGILAGGVRSSSQGRTSRGLPFASKLPGLSRLGKNIAIGREDSASTIAVHASIIDFKELEGALLASAPGGRSAFETALWEAETEAVRLSNHVAPATRVASRAKRATTLPLALTRSTPPGVAELRSRAALAEQSKKNEAYQWFERGQQAEKDGKRGVAKIYYQMAGRRGDAQLQAAVMKKLKTLRTQQEGGQ